MLYTTEKLLFTTRSELGHVPTYYTTVLVHLEDPCFRVAITYASNCFDILQEPHALASVARMKAMNLLHAVLEVSSSELTGLQRDS
jgi:hypothetical protein